MSLKFKLTLAGAAVVLFLTGTLTLLWVNEARRTLHHELHARSEALLRNAVRNLLYDVKLGDVDRIRERLRLILVEQDAMYAIVLDAAGNPIDWKGSLVSAPAEGGEVWKAAKGYFAKIPGYPPTPEMAVESTDLRLAGHRIIQISAALVDRKQVEQDDPLGGRSPVEKVAKVGTLHLGISTSRTEEVIGATIRRGLALGAAVLAGTLILLVVLIRLLVRPILVLTHGTQQIAAGDLSHRVGLQGRDEIAQLGSAFDTMAAQIESAQAALLKTNRDLQEWNANLEREVRKRTLELQEANQELQREVIERKRAEEAVKRSEARLLEAQELSLVGNWEWDVVKNRVIWSDALMRIYGLTPEMFKGTYEGFLERVHPDDREPVAKMVERSYRDHTPFSFDHRIVRPDGTVRTLQALGKVVTDADGNVVRLVGTGQDITERKNMEEELIRSNTELERFAYVASHDLQEPLRMVASFVQLLARRYRGTLDEDADEFIRYATEGAVRMQTLIQDLLGYSRLGTPLKALEPTDCGAALNQALGNLKNAIVEYGAIVTFDPLPTLMADPSQIAQLFQNLISNAVKFRGSQPPRVHVSALLKGGEWIFSVRDNGIGIDPKYNERIFMMFQRLHPRDTYPGTGIGLAICKKIVERHRGRIWVESQAGQGATFFFTIPSGAEAPDAGLAKTERTPETAVQPLGPQAPGT
ncbi:MAG: PAS domain-containing protein [Planctomycetes bacterium]|nr:PAS domain-containing protein [Planctomycetota bacterium]